MKKILYIITQSELGGAQRYILDLATHLPKTYQVMVAAGEQGPLFKQLNFAGITTYQLRHLVRPIRPISDLMAYYEIKRLIKTTKPDIVHLNSSKAGVIGAIAAKRAGVSRVVYTVHGFVFNEPMAGWKKMLYRVAEKLSAQFKDRIICVSEYDRAMGIKNHIGQANKYRTIHNGIAAPDFLDRQSARRALGLTEGNLIVGTVANFYPTKNLVSLIRAAELVCQKNPQVQFAIIGDGVERQRIENEIRTRNLTNKVILCGQKDSDGNYLNRHFRAFDYYVCSSIKEGFPFSILEAMAASLPIVTTTVGGIAEMIQDGVTGILVEPHNPRLLADGINTVIADSTLARQLGAQAHEAVQQHFSLEQMIDQTQACYE